MESLPERPATIYLNIFLMLPSLHSIDCFLILYSDQLYRNYVVIIILVTMIAYIKNIRELSVRPGLQCSNYLLRGRFLSTQIISNIIAFINAKIQIYQYVTVKFVYECALLWLIVLVLVNCNSNCTIMLKIKSNDFSLSVRPCAERPGAERPGLQLQLDPYGLTSILFTYLEQ